MTSVLAPLEEELRRLRTRQEVQDEKIRRLEREIAERRSRWLTYTEAAEVMGVSVRHVRRLAAASEVNGLPVSRRAGRPVIHEERLREWMDGERRG